MKVFFINAVCGTGSTGTIIADLLHALKTHGHEGKVAFGIGEAKKVAPEDAIKINNKLGCYWHNALSRLTDHTGLYSAPQTRRLIKEILEYDPDVIHLHNLHGYYVNYRILFDFLKKFGKPVVWTLHDCWAYTGHCAYYVFASCDQWKSGCKTCSLLRRYPTCWTKGDVAYNYAQKKAAFCGMSNMVITTPSHWLAEEVRKSFLGCYPVFPIYNGIDLELFRPRESDFRAKHHLENKKIILGVANVWGKRKGLDDILTLAKRLDDDFQLVLVGLSQKQIAALPDGILGLPRTENAQQLAEIYSAADVFVNPSYAETMGLVTAEALACGTPAAVYNETAVPEIVDNTSGVVVPAGDIDALLHGILQCLNISSEAARARAKAFEKHQQYAAVIQKYQELLH